ncbi:NCS2 family permease [Candidatus Pacearchaeota archaeon]|nr:NCS2 family permease [Candidatus Pacearchaeota archaeon]
MKSNQQGILQKIATYFEFVKHKTNYKIEILAGVSTFLALSYIFVVNPSILAEGGFNKSAVFFATVITCFLATFVMGVWAKKPFAVAPGMEMNAYVAFFVILALGFTWQQALGAVFWSGVIFMILTLTNIRTKIINAIPDKMKDL